MAYICTKPKGSCASCQFYQYDVDYGAKVCYEHLYRKYENIEPGADAVFLAGKVHGNEDVVYIIYANESANDGNGSFEIEVVDAERILKLYEEVGGDAEQFFDLLPDWFQGEWYYCDNKPGNEESFNDYVNEYFKADFICGRDGGQKEELEFLYNWAYDVIMRRAIK